MLQTSERKKNYGSCMVFFDAFLGQRTPYYTRVYFQWKEEMHSNYTIHVPPLLKKIQCVTPSVRLVFDNMGTEVQKRWHPKDGCKSHLECTRSPGPSPAHSSPHCMSWPRKRNPNPAHPVNCCLTSGIPQYATLL